jgi:hypothetical protein
VGAEALERGRGTGLVQAREPGVQARATPVRRLGAEAADWRWRRERVRRGGAGVLEQARDLAALELARACEWSCGCGTRAV